MGQNKKAIPKVVTLNGDKTKAATKNQTSIQNIHLSFALKKNQTHTELEMKQIDPENKKMNLNFQQKRKKKSETIDQTFGTKQNSNRIRKNRQQHYKQKLWV